MDNIDETKLAETQHYIVLRKLINDNKVARFAEIGVMIGSLMKAILKDYCSLYIREYWAIDQWKVDANQWTGKSQEWWEGNYRKVCKYYPWFHQLKILRLSSLEAAKIFWPGFFDMVYIDANHTYEWVLDDIKAWSPLVRKGGIIAGHDYDPNSVRAKSQVKKAVDEFFGVGNFTVDNCTVWWKRVE